MLPRVDLIQQTGGGAELSQLVKTANLYITGRQRPSSAQQTRRPPALKLPDASHITHNGKSTRDMSREELILVIKELQPLVAPGKRKDEIGEGKHEVEKLRSDLQSARLANKASQAALMAKERIIAGMDHSERVPVQPGPSNNGSQTERSARRPSSARPARPTTTAYPSARRSTTQRSSKNASAADILQLIEQTNRNVR
jgi:hypothetical protein